jgi:tetratricopeptide (TPR) repeat protein
VKSGDAPENLAARPENSHGPVRFKRMHPAGKNLTVALFSTRPLRLAKAVFGSVLLALGLGVATPLAAEQRPSWTQDEAADTLAGNYLSAIIADSQRDTAAAAFFYREAMKADSRSPHLMQRAFMSMLAEGEIDDAAKLAERILKRDPNNDIAKLTLAIRAIKNGKWSEARRFLQQGGRGRAADVTATLLTAWTWLGSKNPKRAIETVDRLKGEETFAMFRQVHAGLIAAAAGNQAEAEKRLQAAYEIDNKTLRMVEIYARYMASQGKRDAALKLLDDFEKLLPRHPMVAGLRAQIQKGEPVASAISNPAAGASEVLYGLGAAGNRQGDELAAIVYLRYALYLSPSNMMATITLADIYDRLKQFDASNEVYLSIPKSDPMYRNAEIQVGLNYEQMGKGEEATKLLEKLVSDFPNDTEAWMALGNIYRSRKEFEKGVDAYTKALATVQTVDAGHWPLYYFRGICYERTKQWPKAEADFKKALALYPDQPLVLNYLGYSWIDQGINLDEGFRMLRRAVEQRPTDGYIVDSLGWAYYRLGRFEDAVRVLERAVELRAADPVINDHLGDAYWRVGRKLEAGFQWHHAKDLKPEPEDLEKIEQKLKSGLPDDPKPAAAEAPKDAPKQGNGG